MGGKGGGERREGGGEHRQVHTSANTAQQDTKQHKGRKEILHEGKSGNPKVLRGPQFGYFSRWRVGISTYNKFGRPLYNTVTGDSRG